MSSIGSSLRKTIRIASWSSTSIVTYSEPASNNGETVRNQFYCWQTLADLTRSLFSCRWDKKWKLTHCRVEGTEEKRKEGVWLDHMRACTFKEHSIRFTRGLESLCHEDFRVHSKACDRPDLASAPAYLLWAVDWWRTRVLGCIWAN